MSLIVFLVFLLFIPSVVAAEEFEFIHCFYGKSILAHEYKEILSLGTYYIDGIIMSNGENKFLDNALTHCTGVWMGKMTTSYCFAIDPDGDMVTWGGPRTINVLVTFA